MTSLLYLIFVVAACDTTSTEQANDLIYNGQTYTLAAGLEEVFRPAENHAHSELSLTDGEFYSTQVVLFGNLDIIWRAREASVWLYVEMYSPGTDAFRAGDFSYVPASKNEDDASLAQQFFFKKGRFVVDTNANGDFDDNEYLDVTAGTITLSDDTQGYTFSLGLTLENGKTVSGTFSGDFPKV